MEPIAWRPCTPQDFGIDKVDEWVKQDMYDVDPDVKDIFKRKMSILRCPIEPLKLIGNWDTQVA